MKKEAIIIAIALGAVLIITLLGWLVRRRLARRIKPAYFADRWVGLQQHCASRKTWPLAIAEADDLLYEALKRRGFKGKTMGEKLVAAQHILTTNESVWFGHKLRSRIEGQDVRTLKKQDVLEALSGFRQALRDLEVMK